MDTDGQAVETQMELPLGTTIQRETPDVTASREALVSQWVDRVKEARAYWNDMAFKKMQDSMAFCAGRQWPNTPIKPEDQFHTAAQDRYVANITLRHVQSRTASIYGKNPKFVAKRKRRLLSTAWDGNPQTYLMAKQQAEAASMVGMMPPPETLAVLADYENVRTQTRLMDNIAKTLEILFEHELSEQPLNFKVQMKATVRRGLTAKVGYVKLGYQRVMARAPEVERQLEIYNNQLAEIERLAADLADGIDDEQSAAMESLRLAAEQLSAANPPAVVREGLIFTYPDSYAIIPSIAMKQLRGFIGAEWVAEEYFLTADQIKRIYQVDLGRAGTGQTNDDAGPQPYFRTRTGDYHANNADRQAQHDAFYCVWEIYNRVDGLVYVVCEGFKDFLRPPAAPDVYLERFFPWFPFVINETYDDASVFPPSDVELIRDVQMELNRSRQGRREHRIAARPRTYVRKGVLSEDDKDKLAEPTAFDIVELDGLAPGEKVDAVLQDYRGPTLDPNLYDTNPAYEDYLRVLGQQEANLGGTSGATATEASIAEGSRVSTVSAVVDDLDEFLTEIARAAGQVLILNMSAETVKKIVGPGAVWPTMSREDVAREIYLDVKAASTGRPNQAQQVQVAQQVFPLLMQMPGISPMFLASELLTRLDDTLDVADAMDPTMPSIQSMNRPTPAGPAPGAPGSDSPEAQARGDAPQDQGGQGANNAPATMPAQVNAAPRPPGRPPMVPLPPQAGMG